MLEKENMELKIIARAENDYTSKFGVPRQSGLVEEVITRIVFEPEYRAEEVFRFSNTNYISISFYGCLLPRYTCLLLH